MPTSKDPAQIRVGINLASLEDEAQAAKVASTLNEVLARALNLVRLVIVASPVVLQSMYIHSVDLGSWLLRLASIYALVGVVCGLVAPEQAFNGMALRELRWIFEWMYPEAASWNGSPALESERAKVVSLLSGPSGAELAGLRARLRWHGTDKYLCLDSDGWAAPGDENFAAVISLHQLMVKGERVADTYTLQVHHDGGRWGDCWLACTPVNHLRIGGWLRAFQDGCDSCPYKLIRDSSCPVGTCKLLSAWPAPPQQAAFGSVSNGAGFYLAQQRHGGRVYVGHCTDADASLFELVLAHS